MPDPLRGWHSIDAQEYPYVHDVVEFWHGDPLMPSWFQRYIDFPERTTTVAGLFWRAVPVNWPFAKVAPR